MEMVLSTPQEGYFEQVGGNKVFPCLMSYLIKKW